MLPSYRSSHSSLFLVLAIVHSFYILFGNLLCSNGVCVCVCMWKRFSGSGVEGSQLPQNSEASVGMLLSSVCYLKAGPAYVYMENIHTWPLPSSEVLPLEYLLVLHRCSAIQIHSTHGLRGTCHSDCWTV